MVIIDHQSINWPAGDRTAQAPVSAAQSVLVRLARKTTATPGFWDDAVALVFSVDVSTDGGVSWRPAFGGTSEGGIVLGRDGNELVETVFGGDIPATANRVRAHLDITGGTLRSEITVEVF